MPGWVPESPRPCPPAQDGYNEDEYGMTLLSHACATGTEARAGPPSH